MLEADNTDLKMLRCFDGTFGKKNTQSETDTYIILRYLHVLYL